MARTPVQYLAWPFEELAFQPLPVSGDDGVPQVFLLQLGDTVYRLGLGVTYASTDVVLAPRFASTFFDLPNPGLGLHLELRLEQENQPPQTRFLGARRVVLDVPFAIGAAVFRFSRIRLAQANLAGPGAFGSEIVADVAVRDV
jgi:hypothetical protein